MQVHSIHFNARPDIFNNVSPLNKEFYLEQIKSNDCICIVVEDNNNIVGECFARIVESSSIPILKKRKILVIEDICVDKNQRSQGVGNMIFDYLENRAKELKLDTIELSVWSFNLNAIKFYEKQGFKNKNIKMEKQIK